MNAAVAIDHSELAAEARQVAAEIVATKRALRVARPADRGLVARLCRLHDRLDDIGAAIGPITVLKIYEAVAEGGEA